MDHAGFFEGDGIDAAGDDEVVTHDDAVPVLLGGPPADPGTPGTVLGEVLGDLPVVRRQVVLGEQVGDHRGLCDVGELGLLRVVVLAAECGEVATFVPRHVVVRVPLASHRDVTVHIVLGSGHQLLQKLELCQIPRH